MVPARVEPPVCGAFTGIRFGANAPRTSAFSERAAWFWGLTVTAGHRVSRFRAISGGLKVVDDGYLREQRRRMNTAANNRGLSLPGGYELWLGRYVFSRMLAGVFTSPRLRAMAGCFSDTSYSTPFTSAGWWVLV